MTDEIELRQSTRKAADRLRYSAVYLTDVSEQVTLHAAVIEILLGRSERDLDREIVQHATNAWAALDGAVTRLREAASAAEAWLKNV